jgi:3-methyladenine DNA glycosylase AlkD
MLRYGMTIIHAVSAKEFIDRLTSFGSPEEAKKMERFFKVGKGQYGEGDVFIGVRMGQVFALAKECRDMSLSEVEKLLESPLHEVRTGGVTIMDFQARSKKTSQDQRKALFDLYIRRHDRINNWDLVDRSAIYVVGGYLDNKPRDILYSLARSKNIWERRTSIVSTAYFIKQNKLNDTFKIAEMLLKDKEDLIHKATGWMLRFAGDKDRKRLLHFLNAHASTIPRTALRYSIEHLDKDQRQHYLKMK